MSIQHLQTREDLLICQKWINGISFIIPYHLCSGKKIKLRTSSWKDIAYPTKFICSKSELCTKCVLIALKYLTLLALPENHYMITQEKNSGLGGHREKK